MCCAYGELASLLKRLSNEEVIRIYGDPSQSLDDSGHVTLEWQRDHLASFTLDRPLPLAWGGKAGRITCHKLVAPELEHLFRALAVIPEAWDSIGDYGGCFNFRRNSNNKRELSRHAWGIALDLDTVDNPMHSRGQMHPLIIQAFYDAGWWWGGWFSNPDPMHFEKAAQRGSP